MTYYYTSFKKSLNYLPNRILSKEGKLQRKNACEIINSFAQVMFDNRESLICALNVCIISGFFYIQLVTVDASFFWFKIDFVYDNNLEVQ